MPAIAKAQARYDKRMAARAKMVKKSKPYFGVVTKLRRAYSDIKTWDVAPGVRRQNIKRRKRDTKPECLQPLFNSRNSYAM